MSSLPRNQTMGLDSNMKSGPGVRNTWWLVQSQMLPGFTWPVDLEVYQYTGLGVNCWLILV